MRLHNFCNIIEKLLLTIIGLSAPCWTLSPMEHFTTEGHILWIKLHLKISKQGKLFSERLVLHSFPHSPSFLSRVHNHMSQMILAKKKTDFVPTQLYVVVIIHLFTYLLFEMLFGE